MENVTQKSEGAFGYPKMHSKAKQNITNQGEYFRNTKIWHRRLDNVLEVKDKSQNVCGSTEVFWEYPWSKDVMNVWAL